jgi:hypothetical protein
VFARILPLQTVGFFLAVVRKKRETLTTRVVESEKNSSRTRRKPIVMVQPVQYRLGHDRSARAQGTPMRPQRRRHTSWRIGYAWP